MGKFETQGFDQTVSFALTFDMLPSPPRDFLLLLKILSQILLLDSQDNDVERAANLDREHWDYCLEEVWRWIIASKLTTATS